MVKSYQIKLDVPEGSKIVAGTTLRGTVKYELNKPIIYKTISIALVGKGNCTWDHRPVINNKPSSRVVTYRASENYPIGKIHLLQQDINDKVPVEAGTYESPFEFELSEYIPPTFKSGIGEIKYYLVLKFKQFGFFTMNKEYSNLVHICPAVPSTIPNIPITVNIDKSLNKLFTDRTRRIRVKITIDKGILIPGEQVRIAYLVTNDSDLTPTVKTELIHITTYRDDRYNTKIEEKVVHECTLKTPSVLEHSVANMYNTLTVLPDLYTTRNSNIITREFRLKFTLKLPLPHVNACMDVPVFIGENKNGDVAVDVVEEPVEEQHKGAPPTYWQAMYEDKIN